MVQLRTWMGGQWLYMWLPCAALRAASSALYWRWASVHPARDHMDGKLGPAPWTGDMEVDKKVA